MNFEYLETLILQWHFDRNLIDGSNDLSQLDKLKEELTELEEGLISGDTDEIKDALGDMIVVMKNIAHRNGLTLRECAEHAYSEIKDRTGRMVDGIFIKD